MKIFITRKIPDPGLELLRKKYEIEINPYNRVLTKKEIIKGLEGKDGLLCLLTDDIDKEVISSESKLKMIASYSVGYDNIDVKFATTLGIPVSNTPGVLTNATSEMAWALLFSVARRIVEADKFTRAGKFAGWDPLLMHGKDIAGKTLGVVGTGRIGSSFAMKSKGFNMKILYVDGKKNKVLEEELNAKKVNLERLLKESDFISLHVPLISDTYHLIGEKQFKMMKKTAIIINTSRGPVVDEKALAKALKEKWIFGAGLDVYEKEPEITKELIHFDNVVLQPHSASATTDSRNDMAIMAAENMIAGLERKIPPNCVNPEVFNK
ncbi:MAG: D-glycerate dehydrogenase [Thermoplasmata archaeon M9B1D]|nr:MAG: D-glycerate dehydrogenase [Thermoplasmata archaeon M9B1D]PNX51210.1 MAG: D-glycerate dehydrogenase [Thermoplasmata archaeon M8B2D]